MGAVLQLGRGEKRRGGVSGEINECVHWLETPGLINHSPKTRLSASLPAKRNYGNASLRKPTHLNISQDKQRRRRRDGWPSSVRARGRDVPPLNLLSNLHIQSARAPLGRGGYLTDRAAPILFFPDWHL